MEIIQEITDIERERDKITNKLRRASHQTLTRFNFGVLEDLFVRTAHLNSRIISRINDWEDLLETDPEGNPQYPPLGMPESCYSPEGEDFSRKTSLIEKVQADYSLLGSSKHLPEESRGTKSSLSCS